MRVLAVSYFLPPALYPQAIQIGRLLTHLPVDLGMVRGQVKQPDSNPLIGLYSPALRLPNIART